MDSPYARMFAANQTLFRAYQRFAVVVTQLSAHGIINSVDTYSRIVYGTPKLYTRYTLGEQELRRDRRRHARSQRY